MLTLYHIHPNIMQEFFPNSLAQIGGVSLQSGTKLNTFSFCVFLKTVKRYHLIHRSILHLGKNSIWEDKIQDPQLKEWFSSQRVNEYLEIVEFKIIFLTAIMLQMQVA